MAARGSMLLDDLIETMCACWPSPGLVLLDVLSDRMELVIPPKIEPSQIFGTALYSANAMLSGRSGNVWELVVQNLK